MKKTALITGGAKRIGRHIALILADNGYNIALHYNHSIKEAKELKNIIINKSVKCELFKSDLSKEKNMLNLLSSVKNAFSSLNVLINNASIFKKSAIKETTPELFNDTFNINFKAPFFLIQSFCKLFKTGHVINILDTKISKNNSLYAAYTLSKKLLSELTKMSAKEFGPVIRINGICPGPILSPENENENYLIDITRKIPLKKSGTPDDIASAVMFLLNNEYITGQILFIDGGQNL